MNRLSRALLLAVLLGVVFASQRAGAQTAPSVAVTPAAACPGTDTLDQLIKAIDDAVSGPADKDRTCFRDVMLPGARLMPLAKQPDGTVAPRILSVDGWIEAMGKRGSQVFYERQVKVTTENYGQMAHLWSTYETRTTPEGPAEVRGINSIQAAFDGKRWKVISIVWQAETPEEKVPEKYLP